MEDILELNAFQVKILIKKAYEWRGKINKRNKRVDYFKTSHAIERFKTYLNGDMKNNYLPNKNEILLTITWFARCPYRNDEEKVIFTLIGLIYKLHSGKLINTKKK